MLRFYGFGIAERMGTRKAGRLRAVCVENDVLNRAAILLYCYTIFCGKWEANKRQRFALISSISAVLAVISRSYFATAIASSTSTLAFFLRAAASSNWCCSAASPVSFARRWIRSDSTRTLVHNSSSRCILAEKARCRGFNCVKGVVARPITPVYFSGGTMGSFEQVCIQRIA